MLRSIQYSFTHDHEPRTAGMWSKRAELLGSTVRKERNLRGNAKTIIATDIEPPC